MVVRNKLTPTSSINLKEFFKNDRPLPNKPEPVTLKDLEEQIKPKVKQEVIEQKKVSDPDKVTPKQNNVSVEEKPVREVFGNRTIENKSDIKLKTNIPPVEPKISDTTNRSEKQINKPEEIENKI
ncbi:MAG TPA: hypothetical protein PK195_03450, partial [Ignavibacteriaceae bacterium]|nr:hypothetical protein [Ignavibacteriaceae bacterium]